LRYTNYFFPEAWYFLEEPPFIILIETDWLDDLQWIVSEEDNHGSEQSLAAPCFPFCARRLGDGCGSIDERSQRASAQSL